MENDFTCVQNGGVLSVKVTKCGIFRGVFLLGPARINHQKSSFDMFLTHDSHCFFSYDVDLRKRLCR